MNKIKKFFAAYIVPLIWAVIAGGLIGCGVGALLGNPSAGTGVGCLAALLGTLGYFISADPADALK